MAGFGDLLILLIIRKAPILNHKVDVNENNMSEINVAVKKINPAHFYYKQNEL